MMKNKEERVKEHHRREMAKFQQHVTNLRSHIFSHGQWERAMVSEVQGVSEEHSLSQRSTVRLVATAERESAMLAAGAIEAVRAARTLAKQVLNYRRSIYIHQQLMKRNISGWC
jgi:hypothetical protein